MKFLVVTSWKQCIMMLAEKLEAESELASEIMTEILVVFWVVFYIALTSSDSYHQQFCARVRTSSDAVGTITGS